MSAPVTLEAVLSNKEARAARQKLFLERHGVPLVCMSVNMPGAYKLTPSAMIIFDALFENFENWVQTKHWGLKEVFTLKEATGPEALLSVEGNAHEIKALTCKLENTHPLGRFIDIDVIDTEGKILSRTQFNHAKRQCYLCQDEAVLCGRSQKHSVEELVEYIDKKVSEYHDAGV